MTGKIMESWSVWIARGFVSLLFGITALVFPFATLSSLVILAAAFIFTDGLFAFFSVLTRDEWKRMPWPSLLESLTGIIFGLILLMWPQIALLSFLYLLGAWAIFSGIFELVTAIRLRKIIEREWALALAGLASIVFGMTMVVFPGLGLVAMSWMLASYAIVFGILMINTGMNVKREQHREKLEPVGPQKPMQYQ